MSIACEINEELMQRRHTIRKAFLEEDTFNEANMRTSKKSSKKHQSKRKTTKKDLEAKIDTAKSTSGLSVPTKMTEKVTSMLETIENGPNPTRWESDRFSID